MTSSLSKRALNCQRWRVFGRAGQESDLTQNAFCEQHHLGLASYEMWRRLVETEQASAGPAPVAFVPVCVEKHNAVKLSVAANDDLRIEIPRCANPNALRQIIEVLRAS